MNEEQEQEDFHKLVDTCAREFQTTAEEILGKSKVHNVATARHLVAALWSDNHSYMDTARRLNKSKHWTIMNSRERIRFLVETDKWMSRVCADVVKELGLYDTGTTSYENNEK